MCLKQYALLLITVAAIPLLGQSRPLPSQVNTWSKAKMEASATGEVRQICSGSSRSLESLEVLAFTIQPGQAGPAETTSDDREQYCIVKSGKLNLSVGQKSRELGSGGVAIVLPGDNCRLLAVGDTPATYYVIRFKSRLPADPGRGIRAGGSQMIDWDTLSFIPNKNGGRRNIFDRATTAFSQTEMHTTMLNAGLASHPAHTHPDDEIILVIRGDVEMQIGEHSERGSAGDLFFLNGDGYHGIRNAGNTPAEYYAFRWE